MLFKMVCVEASYDVMKATTRKPRQLFVTHSRVLATKVAEYFFKLTKSLNLASQSLQELKLQKETIPQDIGLIDLEEEAADVDLPPSFSQLEERHFPLFLTYTQVCSSCLYLILFVEYTWIAVHSVRTRLRRKRFNKVFRRFCNIQSLPQRLLGALPTNLNETAR